MKHRPTCPPDAGRVLRDFICLLLCDDDDCNKHRPVTAHVTIAQPGAFSLTFIGDFTMQVPDSGGPFVATVAGFLDAKGNPATDPGQAVWASSDETIATVVARPDPGDGSDVADVTLTGTLGQAQITATFGDPAAGGFVVTGSLEVIAGAAVSATMTFTGPGAST